MADNHNTKMDKQAQYPSVINISLPSHKLFESLEKVNDRNWSRTREFKLKELKKSEVGNDLRRNENQGSPWANQ